MARGYSPRSVLVLCVSKTSLRLYFGFIGLLLFVVFEFDCWLAQSRGFNLYETDSQAGNLAM